MGGLTTGDTAAAGASVAKAAPPDPTTVCAKLGENNETQRETVADNLKAEDSLNQEEQKALDKAEGTGMTIATASSTVPAAPGVSAGCSSGVAQAANPNGLVNGGTSAQKMGKPMESLPKDDPKNNPGTLCGGSYVHTQGGYGAHAEAKIMNEMGPNIAGGSMTFNIDWRFKRGGAEQRSGMPCKKCLKMLCHTAAECDIKIFICDYKGEPQELTEDDCSDNEDAYSNLSKKIDNNVKPGR